MFRTWLRVLCERVPLTFLALSLLTASQSHAQVYSGSLTGIATDPSGATVPGAQAVLTDEQKGF